jgi:TATA-box binding protein (TBP) (component of TFIID and TFIIIB)
MRIENLVASTSLDMELHTGAREPEGVEAAVQKITEELKAAGILK